MIDVGYFAGARAYFKRAAEAGSGQAALMVGATYDQTFIDKIGAQGIKADPKEAVAWYERARSSLGPMTATPSSPSSAISLPATRRLKNPRREPSQPVAVAAVADATPKRPTRHAGGHGLGRSGRHICHQRRMGRGWRATRICGPSRSRRRRRSRWQRKAMKLHRSPAARAIGCRSRRPATSETGWVYSRYVEETPSP